MQELFASLTYIMSIRARWRWSKLCTLLTFSSVPVASYPTVSSGTQIGTQESSQHVSPSLHVFEEVAGGGGN